MVIEYPITLARVTTTVHTDAMAALETIDKGRCTDEHPVPLLFVHGGCHAA